MPALCGFEKAFAQLVHRTPSDFTSADICENDSAFACAAQPVDAKDTRVSAQRKPLGKIGEKVGS
jgi:hypothetical protein